MVVTLAWLILCQREGKVSQTPKNKGNGKWKSGSIMIGNISRTAQGCHLSVKWPFRKGLSPSCHISPFFVFWIRFFLFLFYWSVNLVVQCSLSEQLRGMTLRRMIERHLSERDIKSNKDLSWLRAQRVSREKVRLIWTEEQQREATVNVSLWQDREKAVRGQLLAQFLNICFDTTV